MTDYRVKKCPVCHDYWCYIHQDMCGCCKARRYVIESKPIENPLAIPCEERIEIKEKVKKHA